MAEDGDRRAKSPIRLAIKDHNGPCSLRNIAFDGGNVLNMVTVVVSRGDAVDNREGSGKNILLLHEGSVFIIPEDRDLVKLCRDNKAGKLATRKGDQAQRISAAKADAGERGKIGPVEGEGPVAIAEEHSDRRAVGAGQGWLRRCSRRR